MNDTTRAIESIEAIPGDCLNRAELRHALGIGPHAVLEAPEPNCRDTAGHLAWSKGLLRRWLRGDLPTERNRTTERTVR